MRRAFFAVIYLAVVVTMGGIGWGSAHAAAPVKPEVKGRLVSGHWTTIHRHRSRHIKVDLQQLHHSHHSHHTAGLDVHKLHHSHHSRHVATDVKKFHHPHHSHRV
jgi:hypothetical protein